MKAERLLICIQTFNDRPSRGVTAPRVLGEIPMGEIPMRRRYTDKTRTSGECHPTMSYLAKVVRRKPLTPVSNSDGNSISMI
jgi:hypothetical protein